MKIIVKCIKCKKIFEHFVAVRVNNKKKVCEDCAREQKRESTRVWMRKNRVQRKKSLARERIP